MISKAEILSIAETSDILATTVEKDYALSWVLFAISKNDKLSEWIFKGGTCLKKCYFETYRFSEDLDFTVPDQAIYSKEDIITALNEVADFIYDEAGISAKKNEVKVEESINKQGLRTYQAKLAYSGPLSLPSRSQQRIKFDITNYEVITHPPDVREVYHGYSDAPEPSARVKCYSINEILAEKTRALYERQGRARDIYDVVNISRNFREDIDVDIARDSLYKKFDFKKLPTPTSKLIISSVDQKQLQANWDNQLKHQLQKLPSAESFYDNLEEALSWWIDEEWEGKELTTISEKDIGDTVPRIHFPMGRGITTPQIGIGRSVDTAGINNNAMDKIRYAARNRLCVKISYHGVIRLVEPYSLRRPSTENLLLYIFELRRGDRSGGGIKAFKISEIASVEITQNTFTPRYVIEL
ncbi:MAG: nucleotidyl transferase AbiEii/AbiGii toxin family protein [Alphaproteobacteria bacterium]|nr:nucleotidyl transferase AbiEii/AbiGii toxin family protein [Alphaproteobacteria bacterium]